MHTYTEPTGKYFPQVPVINKIIITNIIFTVKKHSHIVLKAVLLSGTLQERKTSNAKKKNKQN